MAVKNVFMFPGQGRSIPRMGQQLFESEGVFRDWMLRLDKLAHEISGQRVIEAIYSANRSDSFDRTVLTHPAIFMIEYSLAQCLMHEAIVPDVVMGASLGSFAAAAVAGCIDVQEALAAVIEQARAVEAACEPGGMMAIIAGPSLHDEPFLKANSEIAGINFDTHFVVSATQSGLDAIELELKRRGVTHQRLAVSVAFHSRWIEAAQHDFASFMQTIPRRKPALRFVCCEQGTTLKELPDDFFWRVVRRPMRFRDALAHLERQGSHRYIDLGPSGTLATFVKYGLKPGSESTVHALLTPFGQDRKNLAALIAAH